MTLPRRPPIDEDGVIHRDRLQEMEKNLRERTRGYHTGGYLEGSWGMVAMGGGDSGPSAGFLTIAGPTGDAQQNLYEATLQNLISGQLLTQPGPQVWAWAIMGLPLSVNDANGKPALYLWIPNGSRSAVPHAGGPAIVRPLYAVIGGWVAPGAGQCVQGGGITLNTY